MFKKSEQAGDKTPKPESNDHVAKTTDATKPEASDAHKSLEQHAARPAEAANGVKN
jgi:hypothetical protein